MCRGRRNTIHELRKVTKRERSCEHIRDWGHVLTGKYYTA